MFAAHTLYGPEEQVFDGRSAILFATIAGVSLGLISGAEDPPPRGERGRARLTVLLRAAVLILLGLVLTALVRPPLAVILDYYGFAFLLLIGPMFLPRGVLAAGAVVVALVAPPIVAALDEPLSDAELAPLLDIIASWLVTGFYPMVTWLAFLLAGLVLARSGLGRRRTALTALVLGTASAVLGYGAQLLPGVSAEAHSGSTAEVFGSGGVAVAVIGAASLLDSATGAGETIARGIRFVLSPLAAAGSMPLTLYTAHAVVLAVVRAVELGDRGGRWHPTLGLFLALVAGSLVFAALWRRFVGPGPLELGMRALTRVTLPPPPRVAP